MGCGAGGVGEVADPERGCDPGIGGADIVAEAVETGEVVVAANRHVCCSPARQDLQRHHQGRNMVGR